MVDITGPPGANAGAVLEVAPEAPEILRMVVVSDIHATNESGDATNVAKESAEDLSRNALTAILPYLSNKLQSADLLVCPGDLIHRGEDKPMKWVWARLHELASGLDAELISTVGNHDVAVTPGVGKKADSILRALSPKFPSSEQACFDEFWAHGFTIVDRGAWRVLLINSCAHFGTFHESEAKHGRFGPDCELALRERLSTTEAAINICVFHHHPQEWTVDSDEQANHMYGGDRLITILEERPEPWMLVHGHTHFPRLDYLGNRTGGPVRLASGSIGANLLGLSGTKVRNQMHVVDFDLAAAKRLGLRVAGTVQSYDWVAEDGWGEPLPESGLPPRAAFGYRRDGYELARWVEAQGADGRKTWRWDELIELEPRLAFLADADRADFFAAADRLGAGVIDSIMEVSFK